MNCFLWFMIGLLAGGFFGVGTMCIVQASRSEEYDELFDEDYEDADWEELYDYAQCRDQSTAQPQGSRDAE